MIHPCGAPWSMDIDVSASGSDPSSFSISRSDLVSSNSPSEYSRNGETCPCKWAAMRPTALLRTAALPVVAQPSAHGTNFEIRRPLSLPRTDDTDLLVQGRSMRDMRDMREMRDVMDMRDMARCSISQGSHTCLGENSPRIGKGCCPRSIHRQRAATRRAIRPSGEHSRS
jgi:hypothetical protein